MESKAQIRWNLYKQSSNGRIDYQNVSTLTPNTIVYGFRIKVSTITRCSLVDSSIHEMKVVQYKPSSIGIFRKKKDGTFFKNPCSPFDYCMFTDKTEAERAQKKVAKDLLQQVNEEIVILSNLKINVENILN